MTKVKTMTALAVSRSKAGTEIADKGEYTGLRCSVTNAGSRYWYRYKQDGKLKTFTIAYAADRSLAEVREAFLKLKAQRRMGQELMLPAGWGATVSEPSVFTVADMVDDYCKVLATRRKAKGVSHASSILNRLLVAPYGALPANKLSASHVQAAVNGQIEQGNNRQAGVLLNELAGAWDIAILKGHLPIDSADPVALVKRLLKAAGESTTGRRRQRYLTDVELKTLLEWLPNSSFSQGQRTTLMLTLWCGVRTGEAIAAKWADIDLDKAVWHLSDTKTGVPRNVQLPKPAVEHLKALRVLTAGTYVCPSSRSGTHLQQKSLTEQMWHQRQQGRECSIAAWTPHDLRRTVRTSLSKFGCPSEVAEAILGHTSGGIVGTYDVYRYERECADWLQKWCDYLNEVTS